MNGGGLMEGAGENSSWPTGGATNPFGHGWNRKMNGLSVVEAGSSGQKTLADVTEECELMRCMDKKYKFIPSLVFQLEETVPGSAYSVENQLDKTAFWSLFWSWNPFAA